MAKIKEAIEDFRPDPRLVDERGPTKARLRKAGDDYTIGDATGAYTLRDAPLERMSQRKVLDEKQYNALNKYRIHWYHAGIAGNVGAMDPNRVFSSVGSFGLGNTERQVFHLQQYQRGVTDLGIRRSSIVEMVICHERTLEEAGRRLEWGNKAQAIAAATEVLRDSADRLCKIWGIS